MYCSKLYPDSLDERPVLDGRPAYFIGRLKSFFAEDDNAHLLKTKESNDSSYPPYHVLIYRAERWCAQGLAVYVYCEDPLKEPVFMESERVNPPECYYIREIIRKEDPEAESLRRSVRSPLKGIYHNIRSIEKYLSSYIRHIVSEGAKNGRNMSELQKKIQGLIERGANQIIVHGAPGTGKTFSVTNMDGVTADNKMIISDREKGFVQFHPSYDYTDFVEGLRPAVIDESGTTSFVRMDGSFKAFCRWVLEQNTNNNGEDNYYLFVIDEINRADLSKVFGELMYCLDGSYRSDDRKIRTQYAGMPSYYYPEDSDVAEQYGDSDVYKDGFFIPDNVIIIGTMNDIDRSVESFDFAMQRRFKWLRADINDDMLKSTLTAMLGLGEDDIKTLVTRIHALNDMITSEGHFGDEYKMGPAIFDEFTGNDSDYEDIWKYSVEPILSSYCRGRRNIDTADFLKKCKSAFCGES